MSVTDKPVILDTMLDRETPEGIELDLRLAGPVVRAWAWALDFLVHWVLYIGMGMFAGFLGETGIGLMLIGAFLIEWFYPVFFEMFFAGQTPGKMAFGIQVVRDDGTPLDWHASLTRNILRVVDFLPLFYFAGTLSMMLNRRFQRLGDLAAGTIVIYKEKREKAATDIPQSDPQAPPMALSGTEQRVLLDYSRAVSRLSPARSMELAQLAPALAPKASKSKSVDPAISVNPKLLQGYANWIVGVAPRASAGKAPRRKVKQSPGSSTLNPTSSPSATAQSTAPQFQPTAKHEDITTEESPERSHTKSANKQNAPGSEIANRPSNSDDSDSSKS